MKQSKRPYIRACERCHGLYKREKNIKFICSRCKKEANEYSDIFMKRRKILLSSVKKCQQCGTTKKLCVHHKDGNKYNSSFSNLEVLCIQCHFGKHRNKGKKFIGIEYGKLGNRSLYE